MARLAEAPQGWDASRPNWGRRRGDVRSHSHASEIARLISDAARRCHVKGAALSRGTVELSRAGSPAAATVVAAEVIDVGVDAYELMLFDDVHRTLTTAEIPVLHDVAARVKRLLLDDAPSLAGTHPRWVLNHVTVALDFVTEAFLLLDKDWSIEHINSQAERVFGRSRQDVLGKDLWVTYPELLGTRFETEVRAAMGGTLSRQFDGFNKNIGRWFQTRAYPCKDGLAVLALDVTDARAEEMARAEVEQKALQAHRMESLGTLASGIAHDFNNILSVILGHVGMLRERDGFDASVRESIEQISVAGMRARDLVQGILSFGQESSREFKSQSLQPLIEEALALLRSTLPSSVELRAEFEDGTLAATVNPSEVQQLVMNLCTNAAQALRASRGRIKISLRGVDFDVAIKPVVGSLSPGRYIELSVKDDGEGMTPEVMTHLFEPFFTTKPRGKGTGLGLHLVRSITLAHGGAICVESEVGQGSKFFVYLPAMDAVGNNQPVEPAPAIAPGHGEHVAYVDDDLVVLMMVEQLLSQAGFEVQTFSDPRAFLDALRADARAFDLLVTDYTMPEMCGADLVREVRRLSPTLPCIISSGFVSDELRAEAKAVGVECVLNKEQTYERLAGLAAKALSGVLQTRH